MSTATMTHEGYRIVGEKKFPAMKRIQADGKGSVPKELTGLYTSFTDAKDAIDRVLKLRADELARNREKTKAQREKRKADASKADTTVRDESVLSGTDNGGESS